MRSFSAFGIPKVSAACVPKLPPTTLITPSGPAFCPATSPMKPTGTVGMFSASGTLPSSWNWRTSAASAPG
ncbi:hypothetical protein LPA44_09160 [Halobacterium sp. KA-4]|uniref:hypothetical protein n=1 Tax=Halobacterium sp. KA-4 TaxID=2896367 RepID=UPI001E618118|nr:hypothetical protein [Halobacterium sp. KA-4]MCD2200065.1 hypothetical protein [Halobacterium sp. KA-4]